MKKHLYAIILFLVSATMIAQNTPVKLTVDAKEQIATVTKLFNGTNIEDLNNQTNGGIFSQLLHGEIFEENVDVDFLNLDKKDYSKIYLILDDRKIPHLITQSDIYHKIQWNNSTEKYDFTTHDVYNSTPFKNPEILSGWKFDGRFLKFDSLPPNIQKTMLERVNGNEQISKFWEKAVSGTPQYKYELVRDGKAYIGRQTQTVSFDGGLGEVGLVNYGLYKSGIRFEKNKPYDGVLRIKSEKPIVVYLSLRDENGSIIAEKPYSLKGYGSYEKVVFELTPGTDTNKGSFGISLKEKGKIDLGFAFLQPGEWGRVAGYPIRKEFADVLKNLEIKAIRYNGSMVSTGADTYLYRWKRMRGPIDERRTTLRTGFNMYATHAFGFLEMLQVAEVIGAECIIGMSKDETIEDIRDFVEYVNGSSNTIWGAQRIKDGHPEPYNLKYIQVDNERPMTWGYVECVKKFAETAWSVDPQMSIMLSVNIPKEGYPKGSKEYTMVAELVQWFMHKGKSEKFSWDPHYNANRDFPDDKEWFENEMGITIQRDLAEDFPGFELKLHPMEENGWRCDWDRGLGHAHNWNTLQRYGNCFQMLGTANTFQPHGLHYMWDQGRIHYTTDAIWFQPSACIDEIMMRTWKPNVVKTESSSDVLDITAKVNDEKNEMTLYIANLSDQPQTGVLEIKDFRYRKVVDAQVIGDCELTEYNTYENQHNVVFRPVKVKAKDKKEIVHTFPRYSYTVITLKN
jgi:hypothetical protein